jgi:hypothetical protein
MTQDRLQHHLFGVFFRARRIAQTERDDVVAQGDVRDLVSDGKGQLVVGVKEPGQVLGQADRSAGKRPGLQLLALDHDERV